jgi:hypothetical protein
MQQQLIYSLSQPGFFSNSMDSLEKKHSYNNTTSGVPSDVGNLQETGTPLPSLSNAFSLNYGASLPTPYGGEFNYGVQNQSQHSFISFPTIQSDQFGSAQPPVNYMFVSPGMHSVGWNTPMVPCTQSLPLAEGFAYNLNTGAESYSPPAVLPPLTPRSVNNTQQLSPSFQSSHSVAFPIQPQVGMEGYVPAPRTNDIYVQGHATSNLETRTPQGCMYTAGASNYTNMAASVPSSSSPNRLAASSDSKQVFDSHLMSVKERFPDLWKYGGLDGRFSSHRKDNIDLETLKSHFHLPMVEASKKLGVCVTVLKKICRRFGISRWPHRKLRSVAKHIEKHEKAFHKGYSDHFSYDEVLELCRKNPEKFSNSSKRSGSYKSQDVTSSGSSKLSSGSFNVSSEDRESTSLGVDESLPDYNKETNNTANTTESNRT